MFERYSYDDAGAYGDRQAVTLPPPKPVVRPLPADFDDLLERLSRMAEMRQALQRAGCAGD